MKVLHSWLRKYTPVRMTPEVLTERLTMLGLEFEGVERLGERYEGFVVGRVRDVRTASRSGQPHRLLGRCRERRRSRSCAAPRMSPRDSASRSAASARSCPRGQKDGAPFTLGAVKIRGVDSHGMICSEYELGLGKDADGIMVLPEDDHAGPPARRRARPPGRRV